MRNTKITPLYERLSHDDELQGESNSILNQKKRLEDYAKQNGFANPCHYTDDGYSGGNFERPDWKRLIADIEAGKVGCVIACDMSRVGRDYLQTGFYTEVLFRQRGVRFIAIGNGVDSADQSSGEFAPFLNIMNEWYLRDCSRKQKAAYQVRGKSGKPTTNSVIYGYQKDPDKGPDPATGLYPADSYDCSTYTLMFQNMTNKCFSHHISTKALRALILETIRMVSRYAISNEAEFTRRVREASQLRQAEAAKDRKRKAEPRQETQRRTGRLN